ncbi:MAG: pyridoxal-phosphate dependent enzyme [Halobacteriaceae archaeon]
MLVCAACGREYDAGPDEPWRCECGHPLDFDAWPAPPSAPPSPDAGRGLWSFEACLPVGAEVTLGEGLTPLVDAPGWDARFKLDYVFPSGSFKDRGATATLSRAAELGVERVVEDSSGNAGAAVAQYAARAGVEAEIYVPAGVKAAKLRAIESAGATPVRVEGSRQDVTDACVAAVREGDAWYASHAWNPAFFAGTATFAFEVAAQRGWEAPDAVVTPLGHGTLFLGAYRGFRYLRDAGWIDDLPRLLGGQAAGYAPFATALHGDGGGENDYADGIQIRRPARESQVLEAIDETGGDAVALGADAVERARERLGRAGFFVEPTAAVGPAALDAYRERGAVDPGDDVVVALTGSGLKG